MTDKYAELRAALDAATPGPWFVSETLGFAVASIAKLRVCSDVSTDVPPSIDAAYIAAAHPETIRALLSERDALREALSELLACKDIKRRIAIEQATMTPETDDEFAELDRLVTDYAQRQPKAWCAARAALAQEQGEKHANKS